MNEEYLKNAIAMAKETAKELGEEFDIRLFISGVAKRASQLAKGYPRLIPMLPGDNTTTYLDIALQEVAIGQVVIRHSGQVETKRKESDEIPLVD